MPDKLNGHSLSHLIHEEQLGSEVLTKSTEDSFDYALKLRTGEVIRFEGSTVINDEWIHLSGARDFPEGEEYPRGIDVRIADIVWVKDAPCGS